MMPENDNIEMHVHVTSTCLAVDCLELNTEHMLNKLLHIESAAKYKHYMQEMMDYCCTGQKKGGLKSCLFSVVSLPSAPNFSKISKYKSDVIQAVVFFMKFR
jgi:hypothetical protein